MSTAFPNEPTGATPLLDWPFNSVSTSGGAGNVWDVYRSVAIMDDSSAPLSPSKCMRSRMEAGNTSGGSQIEWLAPGGPYTDMFVGLWWRTNTQFFGRTTANKMFFVRGPGVNGFFGIGGPQAGPYYLYFGHNTASLDNSHTMAGDLGLIGNPNVGSVSIQRGVWTKIEVYIKQSTTSTSRDGIVRWWVNGVLVGNYTNVNYAPNGLDTWVWTETWDGTVTNPIPANPQEHWVDHLYIATGGTGSGGSGGGGGGGGGGTPQILPAPGNLYPNGVTLPYGETAFSWDAVPGAAQYAVRIHKVGDPYEPTSSLLAYTTQAGTSIVRTTAPSSQYDWWVHSVNSIGELGPSNGALLTTSASPVPPPPNPDPPPEPPPPPPVEPPVEEPPPVVIPPVVTPPNPLPTPQILGTATVIVTIKDRQNPIKKEFHFYG